MKYQLWQLLLHRRLEAASPARRCRLLSRGPQCIEFIALLPFLIWASSAILDLTERGFYLDRTGLRGSTVRQRTKLQQKIGQYEAELMMIQ